ncbi:hypothetical protein [Streptomyces sp. NPDC086766]|uniref:hypothetical protein n=1 Tax=Streptomyces sp. NPDC086766 TaxID=3365754 RepID=UPI0037FB9059
MSSKMEARLSKGVLRSLRLNTTPDPWHELEYARWLRPLPENAANEIAVALLDAALLGQAPARPDRMQAADWALRASPAGATGTVPQLAHLYLAAHTDPQAGSGLCELQQMTRACGISPAVLSGTLDQLASTGLLKSWQFCPASEDLRWILHAAS